MLNEERKYIQRKGPGRRQEDFIARCAWCDLKTEQSKERWEAHLKESMEQRATCSTIIHELREEIDKDRNRFDAMLEKLRVMVEVNTENLRKEMVGRWAFGLIISILLGIQVLMFNSIKSDIRDFHTNTKPIEAKK